MACTSKPVKLTSTCLPNKGRRSKSRSVPVERTFGALASYAADVRSRSFPTDEQSFEMDERALAELLTSDDEQPAAKPRAAHPSIPALP